MSKSLLQRIFMILLLAVIGWGALALFKRRSADQSVGIVLPPLTPAATDTIRYIGPDDTVIVVRDGTRWSANGFPAGEPVVQAFFRAVTDSSARSELIAESPASYDRLGVDSAHAKHLVVIGSGKPLLDLRFGGRGPDFEGFYVRQANDPKVYLLRGTFANLTVQPVDDWRDKAILAISRDSIGHLDIRRGRTRYQVTRGSGTWSLGKGTADSSKVARLLGGFTALKATGFPAQIQMDSASFAPAEREVQLEGLSGTPLAQVQLDSMSWGWMVRTGNGRLYKLDQKTVDLITPLPDSLLKR